MASPLEEDFYYILEVKPDAGKAEIRLAYLRLAVLRHPDKNLEDVGACGAFQKLKEAYETLHDENKRILYDAKQKIRQPGSSRARNETPSTKDAEVDLHERLRRAKEEREWMEKRRVVMENITRLEKGLETTTANIARLERERVEKERENSGWWGFIFLSGETEAKKAERRQSQRDNRSWKDYYENELRRLQKEKAEIEEQMAAHDRENKERDARARKAKETSERHQEETRAKDQTRRAQEKQRKAEETRQKEEIERQKAARESEIRERNLRERLLQTMEAEAARVAAAKEKERETEIRERNLRQALHRNMEAEAARTATAKEKTRDEAERTRDEAAQASSQPPNRNPRPHPRPEHTWHSPRPSWYRRPRTSNPAPESSRTASSPRSPPQSTNGRQRGPAGPKPQTSCKHKHPWPKVDGRHRCSACSQMLSLYIFRCNGCGVLACNDCRKKLKE